MKKKNKQSVCEVDGLGTKRWYLNGQYHREDGPAIEYFNGSKSWYFNGKYHREDGPAIENANGSKVWCLHDQRHRLDGPAVYYVNGTKAWWYHGKHIPCYSQEEFERLIKLQVLW